MPFVSRGIDAWVTDSEGRQLPEFDVKMVGEDRIECWIPSTEGTNFKIMWRVLSYNPHCSAELAVYPHLDGVPMIGTVWNTACLLHGLVGGLGAHWTGPSTARLYEFGTRVLTDGETAPKLSNARLSCLNTIAVTFVWGFRGGVQPLVFSTPEEITQIDEKLIKGGHSGSAGLGKAIVRGHVAPYAHEFLAFAGVKPLTFVFRYAPREWLQAQNIIPYSPRLLPGPQVRPKRERSFGSDVIDIDDLRTDDENTPATKPSVSASIIPKKKQRTVKREEVIMKTGRDE